jgi:transcriptional regulator with XRE-family HTH domain
MLFGERLREVRTAKGLSQKKLAADAETHQQSIARWETGERIPGFDDILVLCGALGVKCTTFEGCEFTKPTAKRSRGRPPKAEPAPGPEAKLAKGKRKRKGGAA